MNEMVIASAFLAGLLGSGHCVGMCGGIVSALTVGLDPAVQQSRGRMLPYVSAYNLGRLLSYVLAGTLFGWFGALGWSLFTPDEAVRYSRYVSIFFLFALGLYLTGWWQGLQYLERAGAMVWRRIEPRVRRFLPVRTPVQAAVVGMAWGWLPCGLVYSMLAWSVSTGDPLQGALLMLGFGAGTLPMLMAIGVAGGWAMRLGQHRVFRLVAGLFMIGFAVFLLFTGHGHSGHGAVEAIPSTLSM